MIYRILLWVVFIELLDPHTYTLGKEWFPIPISISQIAFWIIGVLHLPNKEFFFGKTILPWYLIFSGIVLSGFFIPESINNFTRTSVLFVNFIAGLGFVKYMLFVKPNQKIIYLFFMVANLYWVFYVLRLFFFGDITFDYHFNSDRQGIETINSHNVGMFISISVIYINGYYLNKISLTGFWNFLFTNFFTTIYIIVLNLLSFFSLIVLQSRSNMAITLLVMVFIITRIYYGMRLHLRHFLLVFLIFVSLLFVLPLVVKNLSGSGNAIESRFDVTDKEYRDKTTEVRRLVYVSLAEYLSSNFFGKGILNAKLVTSSNKVGDVGMHNQFATFVLNGGWVTLVGVMLLLWKYYLYFKMLFKRKYDKNSYDYVIDYAVLTYIFILLTLEANGLLFAIMIAFVSIRLTHNRSYTLGYSLY